MTKGFVRDAVAQAVARAKGKMAVVVEQIRRQAAGDDAAMISLLTERFDRRENPTFAAMAQQHCWEQIGRPLALMIDDAIERYHREQARRTVRKKPRTRRR
jgi:hypothetical protein